MTSKSILVPDIGGFNDVAIIDIFVKVGDRIDKESPILVLESDKATIEIPSPYSGLVEEILVKVGDTVSQGDSIITLKLHEPENIQPNISDTNHETLPKAINPPQAISHNQIALENENKNNNIDNNANYDFNLVVIGAGPAGYSAAFRAADLGLKVAIIEKYDTLGGVCLNVGCIPSKALLHMALILDEVQNISSHGIDFGMPKIDIDKIRTHKEKIISKLTSGLASMAKMRKVEIITGEAKFRDKNSIDVNGKIVSFNTAIIAIGSTAVKLPFLPDDPRIVTSTGALELKFIPKKMLVIGGGIIGLEMATVYAALGSSIDIVEMSPNLMAGADTDLVKVWQKYNQHKFNNIMLNTKTTHAKALDDGIHIEFEDKAGKKTTSVYDLVLVSVGRTPNGKNIKAQEIGIKVDEKGFIQVDNQQTTNLDNIYAIGDVVGQPMLAHKGVHEGHIAAENASGHKAYFDAKQIPSVAYTNPEVSWAGLTETQCKAKNIAYKVSIFPWAASGRAIANNRDEGFTKLIFDTQNKRIIGGAIVGTNAGDLIGEICLAIEMGADALDIGKTIHPHPTLCESIGMSAEVYSGSCTDLPPAKNKL